MIVYTAIMGSSRDALRPVIAPPDPKGRPIQYICFTDALTPSPGTPGEGRGEGLPPIAPPAQSPHPNPLPAYRERGPEGWQLHPPLWRHQSPRRTARWHKINAHLSLPANTDYSLWHDATHQLTVNPWDLVDRYLSPNHEIAVCRHPERSCVYQELEMCLRLHYDDPAVMRRQVDRYREEGYPPRHGLFEMATLLRQHTAKIAAFNELWWREVHFGSLRDQLSVNYVAWKLSLPVAFMPGHRGRSPYFTFFPHRPGE